MERLNHNISLRKVDEYIRPSSCLQCNSCGANCLIVDNHVSFIFDTQKKTVRLHLFDSSSTTCNGKCGNSCLTDLCLVKAIGVIKTLE